MKDLESELHDEIRRSLKSALESLERLEGVAGPERSLVSPPRSGGEQDAVEDLREGSRVSPGEAKLRCFLSAISIYIERDARIAFTEMASIWPWVRWRAKREYRAWSFAEQAIDRSLSLSSEAGQQCSEGASGRRNAGVLPPETPERSEQ